LRNIILVALAAPLVIATYVPARKRVPAALEWLVAALAVGAIGIPVAQGRAFQFHAADWKYPAGAADFMLAHHITAPLFNTYEFGAYLIWRLWPQERVFVDGRALNESVYQDYRTILYNTSATPNVLGDQCQKLLDKYAVRVVVMNAFEYVTGAFYPLALALGNPATEDWKLVYEDPQSLIFMRDPPADMATLDKSRLTIEHMESECSMHIQHDPDYPLCARELGDLSLRAGDNERAKRMLGLYLSNITEKDPSAEKALRNLMAR